MTTDQLAMQITGTEDQPQSELFKVYCPEQEALPDIAYQRVQFRQLAAQFTAFLPNQ